MGTVYNDPIDRDPVDPDRLPGTIVTDDVGLRTVGTPEVVQDTTVVAPRDLVRWGPVVAGLVVAFTLFLLATVLLVAIGVQSIRVGDPNVDEAAGIGGIMTAVIALISFFIGGYVAGRAAAIPGTGPGLLNGFLVWGLGMILVLLLAGMGLGGLLGSAGELFQQYRAAGSPQPDVNPVDILQGIRDGAFPAFLSLALPAAAAAIGGWLGGRVDQDRALAGTTALSR
jgi:hypothetical protein